MIEIYGGVQPPPPYCPQRCIIGARQLNHSVQPLFYCLQQSNCVNVLQLTRSGGEL